MTNEEAIAAIGEDTAQTAEVITEIELAHAELDGSIASLDAAVLNLEFTIQAMEDRVRYCIDNFLPGEM